jgi:hypothetical protein
MNNLNLDRAKAFDDDDLEIKDIDIDNIEDADVAEIQDEIAEQQDDEKEINEEDVKEDLEKKTENELICDYLKPNQRCILCSTPIWSLKLNKAYLDGRSYSEMIAEFSDKFEERTGRSLNKSLMHRHFRSHFDARAAAISEYNKRRDTSNANTINPTTNQRNIFNLATQKFLDELEIFDATAKELITKYKELESLIEDKRNSGKRFGIDELIMKQAQILNSLNKQAISKFKALSKVDLESKQGQLLTQLSFIGHKAIGGVSQVNKQMIPANDVEKIYLGVVIRQMLARLEEPLKKTFGIVPTDQKTLFYRELKKSIEGIQDAISLDFDKQIKHETQRLIEDKNSKDSEQPINN